MKLAAQKLFAKTIEYIYKHIDEDLSLETIAKAVGSSSASL